MEGMFEQYRSSLKRNVLPNTPYLEVLDNAKKHGADRYLFIKKDVVIEQLPMSRVLDQTTR